MQSFYIDLMRWFDDERLLFSYADDVKMFIQILGKIMSYSILIIFFFFGEIVLSSTFDGRCMYVRMYDK